MTTLVITNGDASVPALRAAGPAGDVVPWRDVLHDGPVPGELPPTERRAVRAGFLASLGWGAAEAIAADFASRDAVLDDLRGLDEIILAFEHDLYDQLQLIEVLDRLAGAPNVPTVTLAVEASYLGRMEPPRMRALLEARRSLRGEQSSLAVEAWRAFTAADPEALPAFAATDTAALPFLGPALRRLLEERPDPPSGLARTERQALAALAAGPRTAGDCYLDAHHRAEDPIWLGDASFAWYLERLSRVRIPLLTFDDGSMVGAPGGGDDAAGFWKRWLVLTEAGREVLAGRVNHAALNGLDRWQGGVHFVQQAA